MKRVYGGVHDGEVEPVGQVGEVAGGDLQALVEEALVDPARGQHLDAARVHGERLGAVVDLGADLQDGDGDVVESEFGGEPEADGAASGDDDLCCFHLGRFRLRCVHLLCTHEITHFLVADLES
jgi:hypothetical protein